MPKLNLLIPTCTLLCAQASLGATIAKTVDFTDNWTPGITTNSTYGPTITASAGVVSLDSQLLTYDDGSGNSVSFNITLSVAHTGQTGGAFYYRKSTLLGYDEVAGAEVSRAAFDNNGAAAEQVAFSITNISTSGDVDTDSIMIRFDSIGINTINDIAANKLQISSSNTSALDVTGTAGANTAFALDTTYGDIDTYSANVSFVNLGENLQYYFSDVAGGLQTTVQFSPAAVPEPSASALLGLSGLSLLIRRKR